MQKQFELVNSIDIDKVLLNMGQKEKQLQALKTETKDGNEVIQGIYKNQQEQLRKTREKARQETKIKDAALQKMELLRAEI